MVDSKTGRTTVRDIVPCYLDGDRTSVVTSKGVEYVFVTYNSKRIGNFHFVRRTKLKPEQVIISVPDKYGVMENTHTGLPILCKLEKLHRLMLKHKMEREH